MNWTQETTMETLWSNGCSDYGTALKYGDKVLATKLTVKGFTAAIYEFIEDENDTGLSYIECRINRRCISTEFFDDNGDAIAWCFEHLND